MYGVDHTVNGHIGWSNETTGEIGYYAANLYIDGVWTGNYTNSVTPNVRQTYASRFDGEKAVKLAIGNTAGGAGYACGGKNGVRLQQASGNDTLLSRDTSKGTSGSFRCLFGTQNLDAEDLKRLSSNLNVDERTCPAFSWHGSDDISVDVESSIDMAVPLKRAGIKFELHISRGWTRLGAP